MKPSSDQKPSLPSPLQAWGGLVGSGSLERLSLRVSPCPSTGSLVHLPNCTGEEEGTGFLPNAEDRASGMCENLRCL